MTVTGINELAQMVEYNNIVKTHEKRGKKELIKQRTLELLAQGIEKEIAQVMAKVEYEYEM